MKLSIRELRRQADQFVKDGHALAAVGIYVAVLRRAPEDYEARLSLADALARAGAREQAAKVYEAAALLCINGGRPLVALVACRALGALGGSSAGLLTRLSVLYGRGSSRLASVGARLNVCGADYPVDAREFRKKRTVAELLDEAVQVGASLASVGELPLKFFPAPLLSELSPVRLVQVVRAMKVHRLPAGQVVFRQGDAGESCYLVARGKVRIIARDAQGVEHEVATLTDNAVFGEMSLITGMPRSATVQAIEDTDLLELGPEALAAMDDELSRVAPEMDRLAQRRWMANLVQHNPMFRPFSAEERKQLLGRFEAIEVPRGTILLDQGERPKGIYIVVRGQVATVRRQADSAPTVVSRLGPGSMPGIEAALADAPAPTAVVALVPSAVLFLSNRFFRRLAAAVPGLVQAIQASKQSTPPPIPTQREISHAC